MASLKDQPARHIVASYPLRFTTRVLYSDMDAFRHVNNGATGRYFEEGRADLNIRVFGPKCMTDPGDLQLLFANVIVDYIRQGDYPGSVEIATAVSRIGNSSYVIAQAAFQHGECFALAEAVMVKAIAGKAERLLATEVERMRTLMLLVDQPFERSYPA